MAQGIVVVGSGVDPASYYNKTQVDNALAGKLSTSGGSMTGPIFFGPHMEGIRWQTENGDVYDLRPYSSSNLFQLVRTITGVKPYGVFNVHEDGTIEFVCLDSSNEEQSIAVLKPDGIHGKLIGTADAAGVASVAATLAQNGNSNVPMTFHWSGQPGQPKWLWGSDDGKDIYVYDPANFRVDAANNGVSTSGAFYIRIGDGTQICWGYGDISSAQTGYVTFPVPFINDNFAFSASPIGSLSQNAGIGWIGIINVSTTGTGVNCGGAGLGRFVWIAIGRWM